VEELNLEQREAVTYGDGPLLIVAGAGTGKTKVITHRICHLIQERRVPPSQILALTFTDKAAQEMQERVDLLLPLGYADCQISTFHSFGDRLLRNFALELGLQLDYRMLDDTGQVLFLRRHLFDLPLQQLRPLGNPTTHLRALKGHFGRLKDECIEPQRYEAWARRLVELAQGNPPMLERAELQLEMALCYGKYQELLVAEGRCDFADLLYRPLQLLRTKPGVLERLQTRYRYILVDEFQDTNGAQLELVNLLAAQHQNLTVVGDDDQSIYAFRGAAISNILAFKELYPQARQVVLTSNYRSLQSILDVSYRLIRNNDPHRLEVINEIDKRLQARSEITPLQESGLEYQRFETTSDEAEAVAERILLWVEQQGLSFSDFAVLLRTNRESDPFLRAFHQHQIPYRFSGSEGLYRRQEVRLLNALVRVLTDPEDGQSLFFLLTSPFYQCDSSDMVKLANRSQREHRSLLSLVREAAQETSTSQPQLEKFVREYDQFVEQIPHLQPGPLVYQYLLCSQWWSDLSEGRLENAQAIVQNVARFFDIMSAFTQDDESGTLIDFVRHLDLMIDSGDNPGVVESDTFDAAVQVLTVHRSKGLEFPVVFLVGLNEGSFPTQMRAEALEFPWPLLKEQPPDADFHLQEERRLFYVALTRAQRHLWLSGADDSGKRRRQKPSSFLRESLGPGTARVVARPLPSLERIRRSAPLERPEPLEPAPARLVLTQGRIYDYLECPFRYYLAYVLRIPQPESHVQSFGTALHECISWSLKLRQDGLDFPSLQALQDRFAEQFRRVGCLSRSHADQRLEQGFACLERFWESELNSPIVPFLVEHEFSITLDDVRIQGRIDRVDEGERGVRIIDYKSSTLSDPEKARDQARSSLQLTIYAFAYQSLRQRLPDQLCLHFIESGLEGISPIDHHPLQEHTDQIRECLRGIQSQRFPARPSLQRCQRCSFRSVCQHSPLG
jgi:DNA helicase-2/ATP-dependent DNA helicase PcrA